jgi:hypothetical protein
MFKVEFYIIDAFEIYHFLPIYKAILYHNELEANFVIEPPSTNTAGPWVNYHDATNILESIKISYSTVSNTNAKIAITTQSVDHILHYKNLKVRLMYGVGLTRDYFSYRKEASHGFDGLLVNGNYKVTQLKKFISKNRIKTVGYPKHDIFFHNKMCINNILADYKLDNNKKNVIYFPTWDSDSAIKKFYEELVKLKQDYNILVKPHHCTARGLAVNKEDLENLKDIATTILNEHISLSEFCTIADLIIVDAKSGALTEAIYLNYQIPIIALSPRSNLAKHFYKEAFLVAPILNSPIKLLATIKNMLTNDKYKYNRKKYSNMFYKSSRGNDSQKAISVIKELLTYTQISQHKPRNLFRKAIKLKIEYIINNIKYQVRKTLLHK